jgi:nitroreductase
MELIETLRTTGAVRDFLPEAIPDDVVHRILDNARFAPSGGNRQGWHVVIAKDPATRRAIRDAYLPTWDHYLAQRMVGLTPWAPVTDREAEARAIASAEPTSGDGFPYNLEDVPVVLVVFADLRALAAVDRDHSRYTFAGGASIYPFVWSVLLAAREEGLGGVITTMAIGAEEELTAALDAPPELALAAVVALGRPVRQPRRLSRGPVESFTTVDRVDGEPFTA